MRCVIVHYHELALKGRNREYFERQLVRNIQLAVKGSGITQVETLRSRIRIVLPPHATDIFVTERLCRVFGIANFSITHSVPLDLASPNLNSLNDAICEELAENPLATFRVTARRADKRLACTSMDVERSVGTAIRTRLGKTVSLSKPELTVYVELLSKDAYFSTKKVAGPGGLPVGVSGKVACLISGGIDSPVAAYRMMKRGCRALFVHFSGRPLISRASEEKAQELVQLLTTYQYDSTLHVVPFGEIQREIVAQAPAPFRIVLYRRLMLRIAEALAYRHNCWGLVTGDSLGQVASQTPENLSVIQEAVQLPMLRPLIGMDKLEITDQARQIGSFPISIEPDQDCCSLFTPPHPSTRTRLQEIQKIERDFDIAAFVNQGLDKIETTRFTASSSSPPFS